MKRDYQEENKKRTDKEIKYRVFENKDYIKVSKTVKSKTQISIHPYIKDTYKEIIGDNLSGAFEDFLKAEIEKKLGKKIVFKS